MTRHIWHAALMVTAVAFAPVTMSLAQSTYTPPAQRDSMGLPIKPTPQSAPAHTAGPKVRPEIAKPLQEAVKLNDAQDYAGALVKIREADAVGGKTPDEEYVVSKFLGSVALRLNDHATAFTAFERAIASNAAPAEEKPNMLYITMVLATDNKNYARAIALGEMLAALGPLDEKASVTLAQTYYNKGDYPNAVKVAQATLARGVTDPALKTALLEVQTKGQAQMGDQTSAVASLEQQCADSCDGHAWGQLVAITLSKMHGVSNHQALNLLRLSYTAGGMTADDYITMATLDMQFGLPAEAQAVLQKGIAAGVVTRSGRAADLLNQASGRVGADTRALPAFEREAAAKANGEEDVKLGETYYTHGQYAEAETALRRGLGKGGIHDRADAQIMLGIVLVAEGKKADAVAAFTAGGPAPIVHIWSMYANRRA